MVTPPMDALPGTETEYATGHPDEVRSLRLSPEMMKQVVNHLHEAIPHEGCGLLAVAAGGNHLRQAVKFYPGTNIDRSPSRFTMDPAEVIHAFKEMRVSDWELGAIVHSHPVSGARPSPTDLREAYYPDALMLIVSFAGPEPIARAWRVAAVEGRQEVVEIDLQVETWS
jgi:[CysO sulfur-carrier protein]-S-L-cysteine hydrolase